jgi:hypothetical protein
MPWTKEKSNILDKLALPYFEIKLPFLNFVV